MSYEVRREGRVIRLTLAREEKRNALDHALCRALVELIEEAERDERVGAILLDARGPSFCAGMDLDEATHPDAAQLTAIHERLFTLGAWLRKPLVVAVAGSTYGGGVGLVANGHVVVAGEGVKFGLVEIRIGMWPFVIYRALEEAMGPRRVRELSVTGRIFTATQAEAWGLVQRVVPDAEVASTAEQVARDLAALSPEAVQRGLEFAARAQGQPLAAVLPLALTMRGAAFASADFAEGVRALRERRPPVWPSLAGR